MSQSNTSAEYKILLLTNRNSDNVGDQVIEATDIALIKAAMKNLGIPDENYIIKSEDASIISKNYTRTKDISLLNNARRLIEWCDVVFFGGAPQFNYLYQNFYERTSTIIDIAKELNKNVVFSAIGIESYQEGNPKCQRLKEAVNSDNVKRITTRDGFDLLKQYKDNPNLFIDKVSDPAVFSKWVFDDFIKIDSTTDKKKIGLFIIRAGAFKSNGINFPWREVADMWVDLISKIESAGFDYELITNGHFGDEAFLDRLIRDYKVPSKKCVFYVNNPESLVSHISSYDAVVSCRLHPSIISYSLGVPSISLVWNPKVTGFYDSIGYSNRTITVENANADFILSALKQAMESGVVHDKAYMLSVYTNIFYALRDSLNISTTDDVNPYSFDELISNICGYKGTSQNEQLQKDIRKYRRIYGKYNDMSNDLEELRATVKSYRKKKKSLPYRALRKIKRTIFN